MDICSQVWCAPQDVRARLRPGSSHEGGGIGGGGGSHGAGGGIRKPPIGLVSLWVHIWKHEGLPGFFRLAIFGENDAIYAIAVCTP